MAHEATIAQLVGQIGSLTEDQVSALNSVSVPVDELVKAIEISGIEDETKLQMSQLGEDTDPGVWAIARVAIIGILSQGNPNVDSALLIRVWTDVIQPFHTDTLVEIEASEVFDVQHGLIQDPLPIVEVPEFTATLTEEGKEPRIVHLTKLVDPQDLSFESYHEVGANDVWLASSLTNIVAYVDNSVDTIHTTPTENAVQNVVSVDNSAAVETPLPVPVVEVPAVVEPVVEVAPVIDPAAGAI